MDLDSSSPQDEQAHQSSLKNLPDNAHQPVVNGDMASTPVVNGHGAHVKPDHDPITSDPLTDLVRAEPDAPTLSTQDKMFSDMAHTNLTDPVASSVAPSQHVEEVLQQQTIVATADTVIATHHEESAQVAQGDSKTETVVVEAINDTVMGTSSGTKYIESMAEEKGKVVEELMEPMVEDKVEERAEIIPEHSIADHIEDKMDITADTVTNEPTHSTDLVVDPTTLMSEMPAEGGTDSGPPQPQHSPPHALSQTPETTDPRGSQGKNVREREDDSEDGPAAKRTRTDDDASPHPVEFKVPELPKLSTSGPGVDDQSRSAEPSDGPKGITKVQQKYLLHGLRNIKKRTDAQQFLVPVDPVVLNIPTYFDVVKHPMDLSTLEGKLKRDEYTNVNEYVADFNQMVQNAFAFNGPDHKVTKSAEVLKGIFDRQFSNMPKADVPEPAPASKKSKKGTAPNISAIRRPSRSSVGTAKSPTNNASSPTIFALAPSGTPTIRRDSTATGDGRPKREIHPPPPRDLPFLAAKPKKKKFAWELKFCREALSELHKPKYYQIANPFYNPVDPVALNIPHYHKVVKKPMDLATIDAKLKNGQYEHAKEFEADVRLMFNNCFKFNPANDPVHHMGRQLEAIFNEKWGQKKEWIKDHAPASTPQTPNTSPEPEDDDEDEEEDEADEEDEQSELKILRKQIAAMSKQVELIQKKQSSPPAAKKKKKATTTKGTKAEPKKGKKKGTAPTAATAGIAKTDNKKKKKATAKKDRTPYVTYEQKQEISNRINTLPPARMTSALKIIRDNMPNLTGQDEELELDIDELSDEVLNKLYEFVRKYAPGISVPEEPAKASRSQGRSMGKPRKNKPMSKAEQEAKIKELQGKLNSYQQSGGVSPETSRPDEGGESSDDEEESGSESEEE
ncbi:MAG: hypothetical protein M1816_006214 [Peltula sp. TS41687]|nr:MAG: hypothetical protein M1816_006214 [Peltula sp. TS41687]